MNIITEEKAFVSPASEFQAVIISEQHLIILKKSMEIVH